MSHSLWPCGLQHARLPCPSVSHYLQTQVHWVSDTTQSSHPLLPPSPPALNLSQPQSLFQRVSSGHQVAKVWELQLQYQSFQWIFSVDFPLGWTSWISLLFQGIFKSLLLHHSSKASILQWIEERKNSLKKELWSSFHICTWLLEKP